MTAVCELGELPKHTACDLHLAYSYTEKALGSRHCSALSAVYSQAA